MTNGLVIWITGLSGAGKSTLAEQMECRLAGVGIKPIRLDGDVLRNALQKVNQHSLQERKQLAYTYARLCKMLADQGFVVICSTISLFHEIHDWNRANINRYIEVFLDVPITVLMERNNKNLYATKNTEQQHALVGLGITAEFPLNPDCIIRHQDSLTPVDACEEIILASVKKYGSWHQSLLTEETI